MNSTKAKVLVVDDKTENLDLMSTILRRASIESVTARSGEQAIEQALSDDFAVVLLDVHMPSMDGFEVARVLRSAQRTRDLPIILVTAISPDQTNIVEGYASGAVDILFKPVRSEILIS
jgi:two-component system sensor histidine kinase/response regulator